MAKATIQKKDKAKLTPQQERFAQFVAKGVGVMEAYKKAGYKPSAGQMRSGSSASTLSRNLKVIERIAQLQAKTAKKFEITRDTLVKDLLDTRHVALTAVPPQASAAVAATMAIAKLLGFDRQQVDLYLHKPGFATTMIELDESEWSRQFEMSVFDGPQPKVIEGTKHKT